LETENQLIELSQPRVSDQTESPVTLVLSLSLSEYQADVALLLYCYTY